MHLIENMNKISPLKKRLTEQTYEQFGESARMLTSPDLAEHIEFLVKLSNSKKGIEIGTFTGYSALCIAQSLPADGQLFCLEMSQEYIDFAQQFWKEGGVDHKIHSIVGDAVESLKNLVEDERNHNTFDFGYIDANKQAYKTYYEGVIKLLRPGGFLMMDNTLWGGTVADPDKRENNE